jgi:hypothetical protein
MQSFFAVEFSRFFLGKRMGQVSYLWLSRSKGGEYYANLAGLICVVGNFSISSNQSFRHLLIGNCVQVNRGFLVRLGLILNQGSEADLIQSQRLSEANSPFPILKSMIFTLTSGLMFTDWKVRKTCDRTLDQI